MLTVAVIQNQTYEFLMLSKDVALGYGVSVNNQKTSTCYQDELIQGKHFIKGAFFSNTLVNIQPHAVYD